MIFFFHNHIHDESFPSHSNRVSQASRFYNCKTYVCKFADHDSRTLKQIAKMTNPLLCLYQTQTWLQQSMSSRRAWESIYRRKTLVVNAVFQNPSKGCYPHAQVLPSFFFLNFFLVFYPGICPLLLLSVSKKNVSRNRALTMKMHSISFRNLTLQGRI